jgi:hypothetical protein
VKFLANVSIVDVQGISCTKVNTRLNDLDALSTRSASLVSRISRKFSTFFYWIEDKLNQEAGI